jgi:hypothetical protein
LRRLFFGFLRERARPPAVSWPVRQALAAHTHEQTLGALFVVNTERNAVAVSKIELGAVPM